MWTPEMVLEAFLMDPNVYLAKRQRYILEEVLARANSGKVDLEIVTNPDSLPGVLMVVTDMEDERPTLAFVESPFETDEEAIEHILKTSGQDVNPKVWYHPRDVYEAAERHMKRGIISVYIGDYFLVPLVANENSNRILDRLPEERKARARSRLLWFDDQITLLTLKQRLDDALLERNFELCRELKARIDELTEKQMECQRR